MVKDVWLRGPDPPCRPSDVQMSFNTTTSLIVNEGYIL